MPEKRLSKDQLRELVECFQAVRDPRVQGRKKHLLIDVIVLSVCAVLCGAEGVTEIEEYGAMKEEWLRKYLELPFGIPSHDTLGRVLSLVDPGEMEKSFLDWVKAIKGERETRTISLDGKCTGGTERSFNRGRKPLLMVSAYSHELGLSLVEKEAVNGSEIDATLECLKLLDLEGVLVEVDAGLGVKRVTDEVREKKGDYLVPLKGNQWHSRDEVMRSFEERSGKVKAVELEEFLHDRFERRVCEILPARGMSEAFYGQWLDAKSIFSITRTRVKEDKRYVLQKTGVDGKQYYEKRRNKEQISEEKTYYVSSRKLTAEEAFEEARKHWSIENKVHWVLDVAFREDSWAVRAKKMARSLSLVRKIAMNLIRNSNTKGSMKARMKRAAWNNEFLEKVLWA